MRIRGRVSKSWGERKREIDGWEYRGTVEGGGGRERERCGFSDP